MAKPLPDRVWIMPSDNIWRWFERPVEDTECVEYVRATTPRDGAVAAEEEIAEYLANNTVKIFGSVEKFAEIITKHIASTPTTSVEAAKEIQATWAKCFDEFGHDTPETTEAIAAIIAKYQK